MSAGKQHLIIEIFSEKNSPLNEKTKNFKEVFYMNLNEFYYEIGLTSTKIGDELGWSINSSGPIKLSFSSQLAADDTPCLVVDYETLPKYDFTK